MFFLAACWLKQLDAPHPGHRMFSFAGCRLLTVKRLVFVCLCSLCLIGSLGLDIVAYPLPWQKFYRDNFLTTTYSLETLMRDERMDEPFLTLCNSLMHGQAIHPFSTSVLSDSQTRQEQNPMLMMSATSSTSFRSTAENSRLLSSLLALFGNEDYLMLSLDYDLSLWQHLDNVDQPRQLEDVLIHSYCSLMCEDEFRLHHRSNVLILHHLSPQTIDEDRIFHHSLRGVLENGPISLHDSSSLGASVDAFSLGGATCMDAEFVFDDLLMGVAIDAVCCDSSSGVQQHYRYIPLSSPLSLHVSSYTLVMDAEIQGGQLMRVGGDRTSGSCNDHLAKAYPLDQSFVTLSTTTLAEGVPIPLMDASYLACGNLAMSVQRFVGIGIGLRSWIFLFTCGVVFLGVADCGCDKLRNLLTLIFSAFLFHAWHCVSSAHSEDSGEERPPSPQQRPWIQERILSPTSVSTIGLARAVAKAYPPINIVHPSFRISLSDTQVKPEMIQVYPPVSDSFSLPDLSTCNFASSLTSERFIPDALGNVAWAKGECNSSLGVDLSVYAAACAFYSSYLPTFHPTSVTSSSLPVHDTPELSPILDTGATHTMLPLSWIPDGRSKEAKKVHLTLADGSKVRALLYNNLIYTDMAQRPLVSVGQLKAMLDIRFIWDDAYPLLLFCSAGGKYVLLKAQIVHNLPTITLEELTVLLSAIHARTTHGELWDKDEWQTHMGRNFVLYSCPTSPPYPLIAYDDDVGQMQELEVQPISISPISLPPRTQPESYNLEDNDARTEIEEEDDEGQEAEQDSTCKDPTITTSHGVLPANSYPPHADTWSSESIKRNELRDGFFDGLILRTPTIILQG